MRFENAPQVVADRGVFVLRVVRVAVIGVRTVEGKIPLGMGTLRVAGGKGVQKVQADPVHLARADVRKNGIGENQIIGIAVYDQRFPVPVEDLSSDCGHNDQSDACLVLFGFFLRDDLDVKQSPDVDKAHGTKRHCQYDVPHQVIPFLRHVCSFPGIKTSGRCPEPYLENF